MTTLDHKCILELAHYAVAQTIEACDRQYGRVYTLGTIEIAARALQYANVEAFGTTRKLVMGPNQERPIYALYTPAGVVGLDGEESWEDIARSNMSLLQQQYPWSIVPLELHIEGGEDLHEEAAGLTRFAIEMEAGLMSAGHLEPIIPGVRDAVKQYAQAFELDEHTPTAHALRVRRM